jgi:hypothetical protein
MIPRLRAAVFYLRIIFVLSACALGLFGVFTVFFALIGRISSLTSFGVDATPALGDPSGQNLKDTAVRAHMSLMRLRPAFNKNKRRMRNEDKRHAEKREEE